ncbi:MAG TPA: HAMP domain-containing sensor histidine kinase [Solirubrobacteraceae bacterium]|nr:HAMP domain-containing sensor histidine kinase [Solirubrobacteraceae bacterium]
MGGPVITLALRSQEDVLLTRRRARDLAGLLQLDAEAQSRLATAVWEVARLAHRYGPDAAVEFAVQDEPPAAVVTISGIAHNVLTGETPGESADRLDLAKLRQLVDRVEARDRAGHVRVRLTSDLAEDAWLPGVTELSHVLVSLQRHESGEAEAALNELRMQNAELVTALATLSQRERQLVALNRELADTNRAVTALLAEIGQQAKELRERAAGNASFLGALTHELRTPLYAVRGMTEAILREGGDRLQPRLREDVRLIDGAMEEALDLVNDHLDLARLAAGREVVRVTEVHVDELFSALRGIVAHLPRSPAVTVVFEDLNGVPTLRTDAFKLSQILRNYVVNGLKFTERGEVRVSAVAVDAGAQVCFAVSDTGPGLDVSDHSRIFEEFVQLERTGTVGELRGSGLGLSICKRLATLLGGEVGVSSELGRGSTFTATIPAVFIPGNEDVEVVAEGG